ncbi:unnamed protein product, partial [Ectocarpus sp. 12 AP-2014]
VRWSGWWSSGARRIPPRGWTSGDAGVAGGVSTGQRETEKRECGTPLEESI